MSRRLVATLSKAWRGVVWYMREISGEARYDHYLEHFAAEHPDERPLSEKRSSCSPAKPMTGSIPTPAAVADKA